MAFQIERALNESRSLHLGMRHKSYSETVESGLLFSLSLYPPRERGGMAVARSCANAHQASDSHFKQPARNAKAKSQSSAAPVLARRGARRHFHPLAHEGNAPSPK